MAYEMTCDINILHWSNVGLIVVSPGLRCAIGGVRLSIQPLFFQHLHQSVLRDLSRLALVVFHRLRFFPVRRGSQRVPSCGPEVKGRRVRHDLPMTVNIRKFNGRETVCCRMNGSLYYPRTRSRWVSSGNGLGNRGSPQSGGRGT